MSSVNQAMYKELNSVSKVSCTCSCSRKSQFGWGDIPFNFHTTCFSVMKDISLLIFELGWWWFRLHSPVKLRHEGCVRYSGITTKNKEKTELITKCKLIILRDVSSSLRISTLSRLANPKNINVKLINDLSSHLAFIEIL